MQMVRFTNNNANKKKAQAHNLRKCNNHNNDKNNKIAKEMFALCCNLMRTIYENDLTIE